MHRRLRYVVWGLLLLGGMLAGVPARAQDVSVQATVSETTIGVQETVAYTIEITGSSIRTVQTPKPPQTQGLVLGQSVPSTRRNMSMINGQVEQQISFTWPFRPMREGTAYIEPATVIIDGQTYRSDGIRLNVVPQAQATPGQQGGGAAGGGRSDADPVADSDLFIRAIASQRQAYQGEQVFIEYQLFFRDGVQLRQSRLADAGEAQGFWREELDVDSRPIPRSVIENGLRYNMITLKRVAVFPTRSGTLSIEPLRIQTEAYVPNDRGNPFERFFSLRSQYEPVDLASPAVTIDVRPLPDGAPDSFEGAVGQFTMDVALDRTEVEVGEAVQVQIELAGTGNIATLDGPDLEPPGIFEQYDPEVNTAINRGNRQVRGTKIFTYILVPRSNGTFELPGLAFSYFDPAQGRYETLHAEPRTIRVTGTATSPMVSGTTAQGLPVDDITGLMTAPVRWVALGSTPLYRHPGAYAALLLPLLLLGGLYAVQRRNARLAADVGLARRRRAHPLARKHLKQAEALLRENKPHAFYEEISRAVQGFIGNRLNVAERGLTRTRLNALLAERGVSAETRQMLQRLLDECDQARFSPELPSQEVMASACERAASLIVHLDERLAREAPAGV